MVLIMRQVRSINRKALSNEENPRNPEARKAVLILDQQREAAQPNTSGRPWIPPV
jgi:hypothetical protein